MLADITKTSEFKNWFGRSKIKKSGKPLIVYHGTNVNFNEFDNTVIGKNSGNFGHFGYGFYFSFDKREAATYGKYILPVYLRIEKPFYATVKNLSAYAKEFGGYEKVNIAIDKNWLLKKLKVKDPVSYALASNIIKYGYEKGWSEFLKYNEIDGAILDLNDVAEWVNSTSTKEKEELNNYIISDVTQILGKPRLIQDYPFHSQPQLHYMTDMGNRSEELTTILKKEEYDGIIAGSEIVAFYPNQIKSATDNRGAFSSKSNNIYEGTMKKGEKLKPYKRKFVEASDKKFTNVSDVIQWVDTLSIPKRKPKEISKIEHDAMLNLLKNIDTYKDSAVVIGGRVIKEPDSFYEVSILNVVNNMMRLPIEEYNRVYAKEAGKDNIVKGKFATYVHKDTGSYDRFLSNMKDLELFFSTLKGFHKLPLQKLVVEFVSSSDMSVPAQFKQQKKVVWVNPLSKKVGNTKEEYGSLRYILLHELGHKFLREHKQNWNIEDRTLETTPYSKKNYMSLGGEEIFAELFALSHWEKKYPQYKEQIEKFKKLIEI